MDIDMNNTQLESDLWLSLCSAEFGRLFPALNDFSVTDYDLIKSSNPSDKSASFLNKPRFYRCPVSFNSTLTQGFPSVLLNLDSEITIGTLSNKNNSVSFR